MNTEQNVILQLIRGEEIPESVLSAVNWKALFFEAIQQAIFGLVFDAAGKYHKYIPEALYKAMSERQLNLYAENLRTSFYQGNLVRLLNERNDDYLILKGTASAAYWPKPELRQFGDCDFLIPREKKEEISDLLESDGYVKHDTNHSFHIGFTKDNNISFEMHFEIPGLPVGEKRELIQAYIADIFGTTAEKKYCGCQFRSPAPEYHGLILLLHMAGHMFSLGIGLRHLIDYGFFVSATNGEPFWAEKLNPFLKEIGLYRYSQVAAKTGSLYFGTVCPDWAADVEEDVCEGLLRDVFLSGNFGVKNRGRSYSTKMISNPTANGVQKGKIRNLYHSLHDLTPSYYPITKKIKILHPVMDCWRAVKYIGLEIKGERSSILKTVGFAEDRRKLYEKLKIFEDQE